MPRKPRIEFEGAFYHVITRGNQKQKIFKDLTDYQKYLQILTIYKNRYHCFLYAYVLMNNHVHLLIETQDVPLSKVLQGINQTYTMYFNRKYRTVGHLFQGRYKAILCDRDAYLLALLKYIHHNPIRAKIAETIDAYPWSSHYAYIGKANPLSLVDIDQVLRMYSENKTRARKHYRAFMQDGVEVKKEEIYAVIDQRLQGDEEFVERIMEKHEADIKKGKRKKEYTIPEIAKAAETHHGVSIDQLRSTGRTEQIVNARRIVSLIAKEYGYKGRELAKYLQKDPAAVTGYLRQGEKIKIEVERVAKTLVGTKKGTA
jgi:putative transposase